MKGVAVSQCTFSTNGHAVVSNWISGNRLRPTYSVCKIPYVASWCTFLLKDFALKSRSADINAKTFRWNSISILHGVGRSITTIFPKKYNTPKADIHYRIRFQSVFMYTLKHVYTYSRPHEYIKLSRIAKMIIRESLYIIKGEREGNEGCCCEPVHLLDEWTCSSVKLNKWEPLASHLLSL